VALYPQTGTWHDFATSHGGDVVALVQTVRQCGFRDAIDWLADFAGMSVPGEVHQQEKDVDSDWETDLCAARSLTA
jgi:hypothetical protein